VPDNAYCADVADWPEQDVALELGVLELVNQRRAEGANCGPEGSFGPAPPVGLAPGLICAARVHSLDMAVRGFFDHTNPDGESPFDRMGYAGYSYITAGENIARGQNSAAAVMDAWMNSPGHCRNIMSPDFAELGVGAISGSFHWTQVFGTPQ